MKTLPDVSKSTIVITLVYALSQYATDEVCFVLNVTHKSVLTYSLYQRGGCYMRRTKHNIRSSAKATGSFQPSA